MKQTRLAQEEQDAREKKTKDGKKKQKGGDLKKPDEEA